MDFWGRTIALTMCASVAACEGPPSFGQVPPVLTPLVTVVEAAPTPIPLPTIAPTVSFALRIEVPASEPEPEPEPIVAVASTEIEEAEQPLTLALVTEQAPAAGDQPQPVRAPEEKPFLFLGEPVEPGTFTQRTWYSGETFYGSSIPTPVLVAAGQEPGPTLCLTAAVHGDELNGIESVRRVMYEVNVEKLKGRLIGVPIVNLQGFQRHSRYLPDRRDLNRFFPGNQGGSSAARMAHSFFHDVILHCDALVDLHTGSFHRTNLPQLRADLNNEAVVELTQGFGSTVILNSRGAEGTLRYAAVAAGIPSVTLEAGEPLRVGDDDVKHSVKGIFTLLDTMGMYNKRSLWGNPEPVYYTASWIRADGGGILFSHVRLGRKVSAGELLGTVTDPITNEVNEIRSPHNGRIIGMAVNQFVMPGFATYHIGHETPVEEMLEAPENGLDHSVAAAENQDSRDND